MRTAFFLAVLFFIRTVAGADLDGFDAYCRKALKDWNVPGFAIAIVKDNEAVLARGYGVKELGKADPVTEHTLFAIASNTKAFVAGSVAVLVNQKKLKWDDHAQDRLAYFQVFDDPWISRETRVDDLLCHRLGFRTFSGDLLFWNTPYTAEEVVRRARYLKPQFGFRRGYGYSNLMFIAAGELIGKVAGKPWPEFVRAEILNPLGMTNTALSVAELNSRPDVATPHRAEEDGSPVPIEWMPWTSATAAGGIVSSAHDLSRWLRLQLNMGEFEGREFWTPTEAWRMWSVHTPIHIPNEDSDANMLGAGLGWFVINYKGEYVVRHGGALDGMFSHTLMAPRKKIGVVILSNGMTSLPGALVWRALDEMLGQTKRDWSGEVLAKTKEAREKKKKAGEDEASKRIKNTKPSRALSEYAGRYGGPMYGEATITLEKGKLVLHIEPNLELVADLHHWQHDVFEVKWRKKHAWFGDGKLQFLLDQNSAVTEFKMDVPNEDFWFDELEFKRLAPGNSR